MNNRTKRHLLLSISPLKNTHIYTLVLKYKNIIHIFRQTCTLRLSSIWRELWSEWRRSTPLRCLSTSETFIQKWETRSCSMRFPSFKASLLYVYVVTQPTASLSVTVTSTFSLLRMVSSSPLLFCFINIFFDFIIIKLTFIWSLSAYAEWNLSIKFRVLSELVMSLFNLWAG